MDQRRGGRNQKHKLTKSFPEMLKPPEKGYAIYRDTDIRGFAVRVTPRGVKALILERRVKGKTSPMRETLGRVGDITVDEARKKAAKSISTIVFEGKDPREERGCPQPRRETFLENAQHPHPGPRFRILRGAGARAEGAHHRATDHRRDPGSEAGDDAQREDVANGTVTGRAHNPSGEAK